MHPLRCDWCGATGDSTGDSGGELEALPSGPMLCRRCRRTPAVPARLASAAEAAWDEEADLAAVAARIGLSPAATRELLERLGLITPREREIHEAQARRRGR